MNSSVYFRKNGWQQGDVIDDKLYIEALIKKSRGYKPSSSPDLLVVISQNCDILHQKEDEPYIDLLIGSFNKKDNILLQGRNPRKLQIDHLKGTIGFVIHDIIHIDKKEFENVNPKKSSVGLNPKDIKLIVRWISRRYIRAAFPDEFMKRLPKKHIDKIQKNPLMGKVSLIFIDIDNKELESSQVYNITIVIGVQNNSSQEIKTQAEDIFYDAFNTTGISAEVHVYDEYDITYRIISTYKRFDWDFRSLPEDSNTAIPAAEIDRS